ncbi:hypothetical protein [Gellertiella hungarica]|uniref:Uncharacterized protein n=1 Tax=Gellertiella hungarica TaxID=1572859 RepID=A0A7W6J3G4_9HYPH|nr:hypothetical protein [Gellertiella hungarica]MBB4064017.1 hypothetical protein [Gellertiella hungarica]
MKDSVFIKLLSEHGIDLPDVDRIRIPAHMLPVLSSLLRTMRKLGLHREIRVTGISLTDERVRLDFEMRSPVGHSRARDLHLIMCRAEAEFLTIADDFTEVLRNVS